MNLFNEAIYNSYLAHSGKGQTWSKHKYLYITPSGRYVYESDLKAGNAGKIDSAMKKGSTLIKSKGTNTQSISINKNKTTTSQPAARANRNTIEIRGKSSIAPKTKATTASISSDKSTADKSTSNDGSRYKNMSEETKAWLMKGGDKEKKGKTSSSKKGGSGKKSGSKKKTGSGSTTKSSTKRTITKESQQLGLTEEDLDNIEVNTEATNRDDVLKNLAIRVIRGDYGDGAERREKLGKYYNEIQKRVNEMLRERKVVKHSDTDDFLMHWGKKRRSGRYSYGSGDRPYQHESRRKREKMRKTSTFRDRRSMSDEELGRQIARVKKEVELYRAERDNRSQGQRFAEDVVTKIGRDVLTTAGKGALLYAGKKFAEKVLDNKELGDAMWFGGPEKKKK